MANIVVDCGHAKVLDLSVARPPGIAPPGVGTFCYLSPEQARGGRLSAAADLWGIGITLYEVAVGDLPFDCGEITDEPYGARTAETEDDSATGGPDDWYPQLEARAPPIASRRRMPPALAATIDCCLRDDPSARPTVPELAAALGTMLPGRGHRLAHT